MALAAIRHGLQAYSAAQALGTSCNLIHYINDKVVDINEHRKAEKMPNNSLKLIYLIVGFNAPTQRRR